MNTDFESVGSNLYNIYKKIYKVLNSRTCLETKRSCYPRYGKYNIIMDSDKPSLWCPSPYYSDKLFVDSLDQQLLFSLIYSIQLYVTIPSYLKLYLTDWLMLRRDWRADSTILPVSREDCPVYNICLSSTALILIYIFQYTKFGELNFIIKK